MDVDLSENKPPAEIGGGAPQAPPVRIDTRFSWLRTRMSTERTLMSWNRTALALIGFGFTIYQFFEHLQDVTVGAAAVRPEAPRNLGLAFLLVGTLGTLVALWQYHLILKYLTGREFKEIAIEEGMPHWSLTFAVTVFLAVIGIVMTGWVLLRA